MQENVKQVFAPSAERFLHRYMTDTILEMQHTFCDKSIPAKSLKIVIEMVSGESFTWSVG